MTHWFMVHAGIWLLFISVSWDSGISDFHYTPVPAHAAGHRHSHNASVSVGLEVHAPL